MEARLTFYFPKGTRIGDDDYEKWCQNGSTATVLRDLGIEGINWNNRGEWLNRPGVLLVPSTSAGCYAFTKDGLVLLREPNGRLTGWTHGRFEDPWWFLECPFDIEGVQAVIYWSCHQSNVKDPDEALKGPYKLGDLPQTHGAKGNLELENIQNGRRYRLWVDAPSLDALNAFVAGVRTGEIIPEKPWLG